MDYQRFLEEVRELFDDVYAIHWKYTDIEHIKDVTAQLSVLGAKVFFCPPISNATENVDLDYIRRYFNGSESNFPSLLIQFENFEFNCFIEFEGNISLNFNDSGDKSLTPETFEFIKKVMRHLSSCFGVTTYFTNEGSYGARYFIFAFDENCIESDFDLTDPSKYTELIPE